MGLCIPKSVTRSRECMADLSRTRPSATRKAKTCVRRSYDDVRSTRRMRTRSRVVSLLAFAVLAASHAAEGDTASVIQFNPRGIVKNVRQATARFPQPMVRLGDPRPAVDPFDVDCAEK